VEAQTSLLTSSEAKQADHQRRVVGGGWASCLGAAGGTDAAAGAVEGRQG